MAYIESYMMTALDQIEYAFDYARVNYDFNISQYDENMNKFAMVVGYIYLAYMMMQMTMYILFKVCKGIKNLYKYCTKYTIVIKNTDEKMTIKDDPTPRSNNDSSVESPSTIDNTIITNPVKNDNRRGISDPEYVAHLKANLKDYHRAHPELSMALARKQFYQEWKDSLKK
jgi:hypothetical protein